MLAVSGPPPGFFPPEVGATSIPVYQVSPLPLATAMKVVCIL